MYLPSYIIGVHQHHVELDYTPRWYHGVACLRRHLLVAEASTLVLHMHDWSGREVGVVDLRELPGCQLLDREDRVMALSAGDGRCYVAAGDGEDVTSVHALQVFKTQVYKCINSRLQMSLLKNCSEKYNLVNLFTKSTI